MPNSTLYTLGASPRQQSGVALIVVLLFLMLIMVAGAIAVRQSRTDLNVATSDQAATLTLNASDSILAHIEQNASGAAAATSGIYNLQNGVFGYFILPPLKIGHQVSFCYSTNTTSMFSRSNARTLLTDGGTQGSANALCDPSKANNYTSGRNVAMTQVGILGVEPLHSGDFKHSNKGNSEERMQNIIKPTIEAHSTSVLPGMSDANEATIKACMSKPVGRNPKDYGSVGQVAGTTKYQNISDCLKDNGIPATALVEEGLLDYKEEGGFDPKTGKVGGSFSCDNSNPLCAQ